MMHRLLLFVALACLSVAPTWAEETAPSLAAQLKKMSDGARDRMPAEMLAKFAQGIDQVRETGIETLAKQVGDEAPAGTLLGWDGEEVALSDLWRDQPVVLTWYRGGWCPYCNVQLRAMQQAIAGLDGAGARLVAITPELPDNAKETAENNELSFLVLHDKENKLAHEYGIVFPLPEAIAPIYRDRLQLPKVNGYDTLELPLAATYVIDTNGVIRWAFLDADYKKRAEPEDVIEAVRSLDQTKTE